jgi:hypothetical protein
MTVLLAQPQPHIQGQQRQAWQFDKKYMMMILGLIINIHI